MPAHHGIVSLEDDSDDDEQGWAARGAVVRAGLSNASGSLVVPVLGIHYVERKLVLQARCVAGSWLLCVVLFVVPSVFVALTCAVARARVFMCAGLFLPCSNPSSTSATSRDWRSVQNAGIKIRGK